MKNWLILFLIPLALSCNNQNQHREKNGFVLVEAEHFASQHADEIRKWYLIDSGFSENIQGFSENYSSSASGGKLPDAAARHPDNP